MFSLLMSFCFVQNHKNVCTKFANPTNFTIYTKSSVVHQFGVLFSLVLHLLSIFISGLGQSPRLQPSGPPGLSTFAKLNVPGLCQDSRIQQISPPGLRIHSSRHDFNIDASSVFIILLTCSHIPYIFINNILASKLMMIGKKVNELKE